MPAATMATKAARIMRREKRLVGARVPGPDTRAGEAGVAGPSNSGRRDGLNRAEPPTGGEDPAGEATGGSRALQVAKYLHRAECDVVLRMGVQRGWCVERGPQQLGNQRDARAAADQNDGM